MWQRNGPKFTDSKNKAIAKALHSSHLILSKSFKVRPGMRKHNLYTALRCVVHPAKLDMMEIVALERCLLDCGATILEGSNAASGNAVTHIICHPEAYESFVKQRNERFVALVRPEWVFRTFLLQSLLPEDRFSANPALIFSTLAISAGTIGKDARKVIDGLITHFGGQIVAQQEVHGGATHILHQEENVLDSIAVAEPEVEEFQKKLQLHFLKANLGRCFEAWRLHLSNTPAKSDYALPRCVLAYIGQRAGLDKQHHIKYTWIEECVMRRRCMPEEPFAFGPTKAVANNASEKLPSWKTQPEVQVENLDLGKYALVYQVGRTELGSDLSMVRKLSNERMEAMRKSLHGAIVLVAQHIAPLLREKLSDMLKTVDAKVAIVPFSDAYQEIVVKVVANASFVVCRYCGGFEYNEALRQDKKVVSIYWVLAGLSHVSDPTPYNEAIQRPVQSYGSIHGMQSFVVTLSGYSSRTNPTREELQIAIHATGACMLPVLSRTYSTHLLCHEASGEKYKKALSWEFENILSHEWIFVCLSRWEYVSEVAFHYKHKKDLSDDTDSWASDHSSKKMDSKRLTSEKNALNKTKHAITPNLRRIKKAKKSGEGRFDVNGILEEIDKAKTPATASKLFATPNNAKIAPCRLFDTPTNTCLSPNVEQRAQENDAEAAFAVVDEIEKEPPVAMRTGANTMNEPPLVICLSSDSNADESGILKAVTTSALNKKLEVSKQSVSCKTKKRKLADSEGLKTSKTSKTSMTKQKKDLGQAANLTSIITSLGGSVSDFGRIFDSSCTHIICSELKRTEKFVAGCAAGKWILKPSYLEACSLAKSFIDESAYEWGSHESDIANVDTRIWPEACAYWRKKRAGGHAGAFYRWRFFIHAKCVPPQDMCERIILAGRGAVIPLTKTINYQSLSKESTPEAPVVALFSPDVTMRDPLMKKLKTHKIECIKAPFLIDFITKTQSPPVKLADFYL
ncbi:putative BRCT domain-containing protein [Plasmopara halstedii]